MNAVLHLFLEAASIDGRLPPVCGPKAPRSVEQVLSDHPPQSRQTVAFDDASRPLQSAISRLEMCIDWKIGLLHQKYRDYFGVDDPNVLVVAGSSEQFNPTLDQSVITNARASDPESALAEWDGQFRNDLSAFLDDTVIDAAVEYGRPLELPSNTALDLADADNADKKISRALLFEPRHDPGVSLNLAQLR